MDELVTKEMMKDKEYDRQFDKLMAQTALWPGGRHGISAVNWREEHSYTLPADFFSRPETLAAVHTMYDQIVRAILSTLEKAGFDISDYRNKDGQFLIKADSIDHLIVGEKINITEDKQPTDKKAAPKAASGDAH
jgi:hypothetical protein